MGQSRKRTQIPNQFAGIELAAPQPLHLDPSSYRVGPASDDGLFLHFGGLDPSSLRVGVATLVAGVHKGKRE